MSDPNDDVWASPQGQALLMANWERHKIVTGAEYNFADDFAKSINVAYDHIRQRKANGSKGWRE